MSTKVTTKRIRLTLPSLKIVKDELLRYRKLKAFVFKRIMDLNAKEMLTFTTRLCRTQEAIVKLVEGQINSQAQNEEGMEQ